MCLEVRASVLQSVIFGVNTSDDSTNGAIDSTSISKSMRPGAEILNEAASSRLLDVHSFSIRNGLQLCMSLVACGCSWSEMSG